jgi:hypothetical protein
MKKTRPVAKKRPFDIDLGDVRVEFAGEGAASLSVPAIAYIAVRVVAKMLTMLVPMSAFAALLTTFVWLAAALYLFVVVTWLRDDNWLGAGILIGATFFSGGALAELCAWVIAPGSSGSALAVGGSFLQTLVRAVLLVPLAGGFAAGARWLTTEIQRSDAFGS